MPENTLQQLHRQIPSTKKLTGEALAEAISVWWFSEDAEEITKVLLFKRMAMHVAVCKTENE